MKIKNPIRIRYRAWPLSLFIMASAVHVDVVTQWALDWFSFLKNYKYLAFCILMKFYNELSTTAIKSGLKCSLWVSIPIFRVRFDFISFTFRRTELKQCYKTDQNIANKKLTTKIFQILLTKPALKVFIYLEVHRFHSINLSKWSHSRSSELATGGRKLTKWRNFLAFD